MSTVYLTDDFSLIGTLVTEPGTPRDLTIERITAGELAQALKDSDFTSAVRQESMAIYLALIINRQVPFSKKGFRLRPGDVLYIATLKVAEGEAMTELFRLTTFPES